MNCKITTISIQEADLKFLHEQKEKGLTMSFVIRRALALYRKKATT